jgi:hypothetical protein
MFRIKEPNGQASKSDGGVIGNLGAFWTDGDWRRPMNIERYLRLIAGVFVLLSLILGYWFSPYWFLLTGFVALNLVQSAFTDWCPMMTFLRWLGVGEQHS